jgi:hypothetical protein
LVTGLIYLSCLNTKEGGPMNNHIISVSTAAFWGIQSLEFCVLWLTSSSALCTPSHIIHRKHCWIVTSQFTQTYDIDLICEQLLFQSWLDNIGRTWLIVIDFAGLRLVTCLFSTAIRYNSWIWSAYVPLRRKSALCTLIALIKLLHNIECLKSTYSWKYDTPGFVIAYIQIGHPNIYLTVRGINIS